MKKQHATLLSTLAFTAATLLYGQNVIAQVKIGDNPQTLSGSAVLELESTDKGFLLPRVALTSTTVWNLAGPAVAGMQVYNNNVAVVAGAASYPVPIGGLGMYYWDGSGWVSVKPAGFQTGDFDWLKASNNGQPSAPGDMSAAIYHTGRVGIGTSSPENPLQVLGHVVAADNAVFSNANNATTIGSGSAVLFRKNGGAVVDFVSGTGWNGRIVSNKNVGTHGALMFKINNGIGPSDPDELPFQADAITILNSNGFVGIDQVAPKFKLDVRGDINASEKVRAAGVALTSDVRLKKNILPLQNGLDVVSKLKPVSYQKKASINAANYNKSEIGFIAQEVRKILPQLVEEGKDADKTLSLDYNSLIPVLTKAIQEQQEMIRQLLEDNNEQAVKINAQSARLDTQAAELSDMKRILHSVRTSGAGEKSK